MRSLSAAFNDDVVARHRAPLTGPGKPPNADPPMLRYEDGGGLRYNMYEKQPCNQASSA